MKILTKIQAENLIKEATKVFGTDRLNILSYLSQVCRVEYNKNLLTFVYVKNTSGENSIWCYVGVREIDILYNRVHEYLLDTPEKFVRCIDDMLYILSERDAEMNTKMNKKRTI